MSPWFLLYAGGFLLLGFIIGAEWQRTRRPRRPAAHAVNAAGDGERP